MSYLSKMWAVIDIERKRRLLALVYQTEKTIKKHEGKEWTKLPDGFKSYLHREATQEFIKEAQR